MFPQDRTILNELVLTRNLSERTEKTYEQAITLYTKQQKLSLQELLTEAENEEEQGIRWKNRRLRQRLINYRNYLHNTYMNSTAKLNYNKITTIYRHYEIEIHNLPPISEKQVENNLIYFEDLPTKNIIRKALLVARPMHQRIILFQLSTGCSTIDTINLTIQNLLDSVTDYYTGNDIYEMINLLKDRDDVIPCFRLQRSKTGKVYYTFCTNECFKSICMYLLTRKSLRNTDKVFKITQLHLMQLFREVNDLLGLGTVGDNGFVRFRSHMLRKYHASALYNDGMSMDNVNALQGKAKNKVDSCYFMENPRKLRDEYVRHMGVLIINTEYTGVSGGVEYDELKSRIVKLEKILEENFSGGDWELLGKFF